MVYANYECNNDLNNLSTEKRHLCQRCDNYQNELVEFQIFYRTACGKHNTLKYQKNTTQEVCHQHYKHKIYLPVRNGLKK